MMEHGELDRRRAARSEREVEAIALRELQSRFADLHGGGLSELAAKVVDRVLDPYAAADSLLKDLEAR